MRFLRGWEGALQPRGGKQLIKQKPAIFNSRPTNRPRSPEPYTPKPKDPNLKKKP